MEELFGVVELARHGSSLVKKTFSRGNGSVLNTWDSFIADILENNSLNLNDLFILDRNVRTGRGILQPSEDRCFLSWVHLESVPTVQVNFDQQ